MHHAKGVEFPIVSIFAVNDGVVTLATEDLLSDGRMNAANELKQQRCLFYVATSRARDRLIVSSNSPPSRCIAPTRPSLQNELSSQ